MEDHVPKIPPAIQEKKKKNSLAGYARKWEKVNKP